MLFIGGDSSRRLDWQSVNMRDSRPPRGEQQTRRPFTSCSPNGGALGARKNSAGIPDVCDVEGAAKLVANQLALVFGGLQLCLCSSSESSLQAEAQGSCFGCGVKAQPKGCCAQL